MKSKQSKPKYRVGNWSDYNDALINRGDLTVWVDEDVLEAWRAGEHNGQRGAPYVYSDLAIECMAMLMVVYNLPLRATQGFLSSVLKILGVDLPVPHYTTLSRRLQKLEWELPRQIADPTQPLHLVVDSTGVKLYGDGEWKARTHGPSKRRTWRKLHLAVDANSGEITASVVSTNDVGDNEVLSDLLDNTGDAPSQVSGDGAYDSAGCYDAIHGYGASATIPPRRNAKIWQNGNSDEPPLERDENLRYIREHGRAQWKRDHDYHQRSLAETAMYRMKMVFDDHVNAHSFDGQSGELFARCAALNKMTQLGMPESYKV